MFSVDTEKKNRFVSGCHLTDVGVYLLAFVSLHLMLDSFIFYFFSVLLIKLFRQCNISDYRQWCPFIDSLLSLLPAQIYLLKCSKYKEFLFLSSGKIHHTQFAIVIHQNIVRFCSVYRFQSIRFFWLSVIYFCFIFICTFTFGTLCPLNRLDCSDFFSVTCIK